jgi:hypothetical protein
MNHHPDHSNHAWESAMSRDFDARVRDLHEAPLDLAHVTGKARTIRRNRRIAAAGGVLAVAAAVTPVALLATNGDDSTRDPGFATTTDVTDSPRPDPGATMPAYVRNGTWVRTDGTEVDLPDEDYTSAVVWDNQLVLTRWDGEVYSVVDVVDADGDVVDSFGATSAPAVNDAGTTLAWVDTDGAVMTAWADGEVQIGEVDLAAAGETVAWSVGGVVGGPDCHEAPKGQGCVVYLNSGLGDESTAHSSHGTVDIAFPGAIEVNDAAEGLVSGSDAANEDTSTCGGLYDLRAGDFRWHTCDFEASDISPGGSHVAAPPSIYDGVGPTSMSILDARTGEETPGRYAVKGGAIADWSWVDADRLLLSVYDGTQWRLVLLSADGEVSEVAGPTKGNEFNAPFTLID